MSLNEPISEKQKKKRQMLLVLPLLTLPFVTLAFWALGGGQGGTNTKNAAKVGINNKLPKAKLSNRPEDKMSLYKEAETDANNHDIITGGFSYPVNDSEKLFDETNLSLGQTSASSGLTQYLDEDPNEKRALDKLSELKAVMAHTEAHTSNYPGGASIPIDPATYGLQPEEQQLENLKDMISNASSGDSDEETGQINTMLDKILDIQHPERLSEKLKKQSFSHRGSIYGLDKPENDVTVPMLTEYNYPNQMAGLAKRSSASKETGSHNDFYDIDPLEMPDSSIQITVPAVIAETQTLVSGATIKIRLTADMYVNGTLIPENSFVYGTCTVNGERLKIEVKNIRYKKRLYPVNIKAYDMDAIEGIRIPGAINRDASKEGADRALQSIQMMSLNPNLATQAAATGIEATKGLLSKKVKLIRVTVKAGYPLLLVDTKGLQDENAG